VTYGILSNRLARKVIKVESVKERRLLNNIEDIILGEFI
jgi:hypothetical protein